MATINSQDNSNLNRELYSPLDDTQPEVRLIEILPPAPDDQQRICCRLETVKLSDELHFAALSYVWGDPNITEDISVSGIILPVPTNLASALRQFRNTGFPENEDTGELQKLWVDAICINQKNIEERNSQVRLMGGLYRTASSVLSWLGPPGHDRQDKALQIIREIASMMTIPPDYDSSLSSETLDSRRELRREQTYAAFQWLIHTLGNMYPLSGGTSDPRWGSLRALASNNYWTRIWILQETVLAKSPWTHWFICGHESITFAELDRYANFVEGIRDLPLPPGHQENLTREMMNSPTYNMERFRAARVVRRVLPTLARIQHRAQLQSLFNIFVMMAMHRTATNPRDMIYGMMGMVPSYSIKPDYGKPVKEVFIEAFSSCPRIPVGFCLQCSSCGSRSDNKHSLPSWLPNLSELWQRNIELFIDFREERVSLLGSPRVLEPEIQAEDTLCVQGVIYGHVGLARRLNCDRGDNVTQILYRFCVDYIVEFQNVSPITRLLPLASAMDHKRPLQTLMDVLDWAEKRINRGKSPNYGEYLGSNLSIVSWAAFRALGHVDILTQDEQVDAIKRLGLEDAAKRFGDDILTLDFYLRICLVGLDPFPREKKRKKKNGGKESREKTTDISLLGQSEFEETLGRIELSRMLSFAGGKTLFKTDKGQLGLGPPDMREGDLVCAVDECTLPVLLRRVETMDGDASFFEHVGTCYVSGLSDGELGTMVENGVLELQTFKLR
ncbi:HET-domain-containing protein [Nemania sp. FL0031]|nr:HET-domain-containing protein [Nemania sp. FL0031]